MVQNNLPNRLVQVVNANYEVTNSDESVVVIDAETNKAIAVVDAQGELQLERMGFFAWFRKRKHILVIDNSAGRTGVEGRVPTFPLHDFALQWTLQLRLDYLASCNRDNTAKVGQALCKGPSPEAILNDLLKRWVLEYAGPNPRAFIENYYQQKSDLETNLSVRALNEIGLNLQARIRIESEHEALQTIRLSPLRFPVRVSDYDEEQDLKLEAEVQVHQERKIYAVIYHDSWYQSAGGRLKEPINLESKIKSETRQFFSTRVSLHRFHTEGRSPQLKAELTAQLNLALRPYGREIAVLSLHHKAEVPRHDQSFFDTKEDVKFDDLQEYDKEVVINNTVQMILQDYALYRNAGVKELKPWLKQNLSEVINQVLFGKRYIDLLIKFKPLEEEIKKKLSIRAEEIGYSIKQLITVPDLPPYDWLESFPLKIEKEFETKTAKFAVMLGVHVTARIRRLEDIETYLNRRQSVPELMEQTIFDETRQLLHTIDPERFYMRFSYFDSLKGDENSVEEILSTRIREKLEAKFSAEVINITLKMLDTDITKTWSGLVMGEGNLEITLPSFSDVEGVTYRARVRVDAIEENGWNRFRTTLPDLEKVCQSLSVYLSARLGTFANTDLVFTNLEVQLQIERMLEGLAKKFAVEEFGLVIRINSIRRDFTQIEINKKDRIQAILEALKTLDEERLSEITSHGPTARIQAIEERIEALEKELPGSVKATRIKYTRPELIEPAAPSRLPDYYKASKSLGTGDSNGHESN